ncbi:MAG: Mu transposase C-terminal domain-containing protein [Proteobacteria bacterium]|nr:Mu transposase C-terminal domain-containing protein [Pseudomonadota bacterium]
MEANAELGGFAVRPGVLIGFKGRLYKVRRLLTPERILLEDPANQQSEVALIDQLTHPSKVQVDLPTGNSDAEGAKRPELLAYSDEEIKQAEQRLELITPLLMLARRTRKDVGAAAQAAGKSVGTLYGWLRDYQASGMVGLIDEVRGPKGGVQLDPRVEEIIQDVIESLYLNSQQLIPKDIFEEVEQRCELENKPVPHINTVRNRIAAVPRDVQSRRRGHPEQADRNLPTPGTFPVPVNPLNPVQMDHVQLDMLAVYSDTRQPWGRPWLTLLICVKTRMIVGFYLSMLRPSSVAAGMALVMGMLPKKDYLGSLGVSGSWPVQGKIRKVHCDNAKEFRGEALRFGCREHGIDLELRPVKKPRYGAHIERMVGNINAMLRKKPGTTFSNPQQRGTYDSRKKSAYTLWEIEVEVADWVVNHYHVNKHRELKMPPRNAWEKEIMGTATAPGAGLPIQIADPQKLKLDFLPFVKRVVTPSGVRNGKQDYYHEAINRWVNAPDPDHPTEKRKFIIKYHPRYPRNVWFLDPELKQYQKLDCDPRTAGGDGTDWDRMSVEELMAIDARDHAQGDAMEDKQAKRAYRARSAERQAQAVAATKRARTKGKAPVPPSGGPNADHSRIETQMEPQTATAQDTGNPFSAFAGKTIRSFNVSGGQ